jgi:hypothetical protein
MLGVAAVLAIISLGTRDFQRVAEVGLCLFALKVAWEVLEQFSRERGLAPRLQSLDLTARLLVMIISIFASVEFIIRLIALLSEGHKKRS